MNFTVIWRPQALGELAEVWNDASNRNAVTLASERIDQILAQDPLNAGESRAGENRILFESPLAVIFRVDRSARMVFVLTVGESGH